MSGAADRESAAPSADVDRLYGLDVDEFTPARDATARRLKTEGRRPDAEAVARLRRPTAAAWLVNQLVRREPAAVGELEAAGQAMREAVAGGGPDALRDAVGDERAVLDRLVGAASDLARRTGRPASDPVLQRVRETLHAAAVDDDARREVLGGQLVRETRSVGFGGLGLAFDAAPAAAPAARASPPPPALPRERRRQKPTPPPEPPRPPEAPGRAERLAAARADRDAARAAAQDRRRALGEAERARRAAARAAQAARHEADRADAALADAETAAERARAEADAAARRLDDAETAVREART